MNEVTWFKRSNGGFAARINGETVCYEPADDRLMAYADSLDDEAACRLLVAICQEIQEE